MTFYHVYEIFETETKRQLDATGQMTLPCIVLKKKKKNDESEHLTKNQNPGLSSPFTICITALVAWLHYNKIQSINYYRTHYKKFSCLRYIIN